MNYNLDNVIAERPTKTVYRDNDNTIKLFVENYSKAQILNEALNLARVEEGTDLKVPKLKEVTTINNRWGIVTEYIEGKSLQDLMNEHPEKEDEYLEKFIDIQWTIFSKKVPLLNIIKDKFSRKIKETDLLDDTTRYELLQRLEGLSNHYRLCHGDFNPSNIVITESGEYYVLDWAHVTRGNASADVARTYLIFCMEGKKEYAEKYVNRFIEKYNFDRRKIQRWIPIVAATQLTKGIPEEEEFLRSWINVADYE